MQKKNKCPCCGNITFDHNFPGSYNICPICYWEDDLVQFYDENFKGGANRPSLKEAQENYKVFGAIDKEFINSVRKPNKEEIPI
jgi:hypothetical protein